MLPIPLAAVVLASLAAGQVEPPSIDWQTDLAGARAQARAQGKPMLVVFRCET